MRTTAYLKAIFLPLTLDTFSAMYVTCYMFLIVCSDYTKPYNDFNFKRTSSLKQNSLRLQIKSLISGQGVMVNSVLHYILNCELCELLFSTMRL